MTEILDQRACAWYEYVTNVARYTEALWQAAAGLGLAEYRTFERKEWDGKQAKNIITERQRWVLTDTGLDLYIEGRAISLAGLSGDEAVNDHARVAIVGP